jgi:phenylacetate-CoA ligase
LYKIKFGLQLSDIKDLNDITKLPIVNRSIVKSEIDNISIGPKMFRIKALTSGTTGSPLTVYRNIESINYESAYIRNFRSIHGFVNGDKLLSIRGFLNKNELYFFNKLSNTLYISGPNLNEENISRIYSLIKDFKPKAIEAFPSYLYKLYIEISKINGPLSIPLCFTSSEMMYDFQRVKMEAYFNTSIFDWYGNVERSIGIVQNKNKIYTPLPVYSINEYEGNFVVTTSLNNRLFPLIRYQVDDVIKVKNKTNLENIVSPEIISISGRIGDTIDLTDGSQVGCIDHAFKGIQYLQYAQIHQSKKTLQLVIKLVVEHLFSKKEEALLKTNLVNMIGRELKIEFQYCKKEDIVCESNKKYKLIVKHE